MKTRTDLLNHLIEKYNLKSYLEIGLQNSEQNFDKINCIFKVSVDPDPNAKAMWCLTSDKFFNGYPFIETTCKDSGGVRTFVTGRLEEDDKFDLVFIDGLHTAEQVRKDFENALKVLAPLGWIIFHDCNPLEEKHTIVPRPTKTGHWNGDVYRFAAGLNQPKLTVDTDNGCMIFKHVHYWPERESRFVEWEEFNANRKELLNLISWEEFIKMYEFIKM